MTDANGLVTQQSESDERWQLQAERMAMKWPLIECLRLLAGHYGRRTTTTALTAGLPIGKSGITPDILTRAATRVDLNARLSARPLDSFIGAPNLPCLLVLKDGQACLLWETRGAKNSADASFIVQFPETRDERQNIDLEHLKSLYDGYAFFVRPIARADDRAGPAPINNARAWFWDAFSRHGNLYGEVVLAAVMINLFGVVSSLYIMTVYDRVVPNNAYETLWALTIGVTIVYIFDFILKNLRALFLDHAGRKADTKISAELFEQIMGMTMEARPASAGILASKMREFETIRDFFTSATLIALIDLPFVLIYVAVMAFLGGPLALIPVLAIPVVVGASLFLQKPLERVVRESLNESALKNALLFETFTGLETIKVQAAEGHTQRAWEEISDKAARTAVKVRRISTWSQNFAVFIQQMVSVFIVVAGVYSIAAGYMSMGALVACVILSGRAMAPLAQVAGLMSRMSQSFQSLKHLDDLMKKPVERPAGKNFIAMPALRGKVEFREVGFAYPGQSLPALQDISFTIEPGERVGIIGSVGSGKTTIERLLLNLYQPQTGSVQIDGVDVRQIDPGDLRRNIGAVQQSPQLFYGSVRFNITMGNENAFYRSVLKAAELSGVMEFLRESSAGLDTQVGERGEALSGGQRQAIAIARALLYDPPILILDEPTASMDPASENRLRKRLDVVGKGKTVILITHKAPMLSIVDKLILMDHGRLVDFGPRDEVIRKLQTRQYGTAAEQTDV